MLILYRKTYFSNTNLDSSLPNIAITPLQEYQEIFLEELVPFRGIKHQIDFIPKDVISNWPVCLSSLKEIKELQEQVDEVLSKGNGRENMSPMCCSSCHYKGVDSMMNLFQEGENDTNLNGWFHGHDYFYVNVV